MNRYKVSISPQAYRELDYIFAYIKNEFKSIDTAASIFLSLRLFLYFFEAFLLNA